MGSKRGHRRGRSLSEGLMLEETEKGALIVSGINNDSSANQGLKEGDEIVGATIHFDELSKADVLKLLKLIEPFDKKVELLSKNKNCSSKSLGSLDRCVKAPEEMLTNSYNRLYNDKIKKLIKDDTPVAAGGGSLNGELKPSLKDDIQPSIQVMDTNTPQVAVPTSKHSPDIRHSPPVPTNTAVLLNDPSKGNSLHIKVPGRPDVDIQSDVNPPNTETDLKIPDLNTPDVNVQMPKGKVRVQSCKKQKNPDLDVDNPLGYMESPEVMLSGSVPKGQGLDIDLNTPMTDVPGLTRLNADLLSVDPKFTKADLKLPYPETGLSSSTDTGLKRNVPDCIWPNSSLDQGALDSDITPHFVHDGSSDTLEIPKCKLSSTLPKLPEMDIDAEVKTLKTKAPMIKGGVDISNGSLPKADIKVPKMDINIQDADTDYPSGKMKMPKFKVPKLDLSRPQGLEVNNVGDLEGPNLSFSSPKFETEMPSPVDLIHQDVDVDSPHGKFKVPHCKMPNSNLTGPNVTGPDCGISELDLTAHHLKGGYNPPDLSVPHMDLKEPKLDLTAPDLSISMPSGKVNLPNLKKPDSKLSLSSVKEDAPKGKFKMPKLFGTLSKKTNVDINTGFTKPELSLKAPNIKSGIDGEPRLDANTPSIDIGSPKEKFRMPKLKMPDFDLSGQKEPRSIDIDGQLDKPTIQSPNFNARVPDSELDISHKLDLNAPDGNFGLPLGKVKTTNMDLKAPDLNFGAPAGTFKMPTFGMSSTLPKETDLHVKTPKLKSGLYAPELSLPDVDLKPQINVNTPGLDVDVPSGKLKMPKFKVPKFSLLGLKGPKLPSEDLKSPDVDINTPQLNIKGSKTAMQMPTADIKGHKLDVSAPEINLNMPSGKLNIPTLKKPKADLSAVDLDVDGPSGKLKMPSFGLAGTLPKGPNLDINAGVKTPDLGLKAPTIKGGLDVPDMDLPNIDIKSPKFDVNTPNVDIGSPKTKFKMPKLTMPKFGVSGLKGPNVDIDGNLDAPSLDISNPDFNKPSGKFKMSGLTMPDFNLSGKNKQPDFDLKTPDLDLSGPTLKGRINHPDLKLPKADLKGPKMDFNLPDLSFNKPSGTLNVPTLKKPKADLSAVDLDVDGPSGKLKMPSFGLAGTLPKGPNLDINAGVKTPDLSLKAPTIKGGLDVPDMDLPHINIKSPKFDVNTPNVDIGSPKTKFKTPTLKMPKFGISSLKGPNVDMDGHLDAPSLDISNPNINKPSGKFKMSGFNVPTLKKPKAELGAHPSKLKMPTLDLSAPKAKGGISSPNLPNVDFTAPKLDIKTPDVNTNMQSSRLRAPTIEKPTARIQVPKTDINAGQLKMPKMPTFGFPGSLPKGLNMDTNSPNLSLERPNINGKMDSPNLSSPSVDLKGHKLEVDNLDTGIDSPPGKFKMPTFKMPRFNLSGSNHPEAEFRDGIEGPDGNILPPKVKAGIGGQDFDRNVSSGNIEGLQRDLHLPEKKFKLPSFKNSQFGDSDLIRTGSDIDFGTAMTRHLPDFNISPPKTKLDFKAQDFAVTKLSPPNMNTSLTKMDILKPNMKMPVLDTGANVRLPHTDRKSRKVKERYSNPVADTNLPKKGFGMDLRTPDLNIDALSDKVHIPKSRNPPVNTNLSHKISSPSEMNQTKASRSKSRSAKKSESGKLMPSEPKSLEDPDGYYVTVFPNQQTDVRGQTDVYGGKGSNQSSNTCGRLDFSAPSLDLEVPEQNDLKGSTFWFSKLI